MALADVYDALISPRVYKEGLAHAHAAQIIIEGRDRHFDPHVVDAFIGLDAEFQAIAARFGDSAAELQEKALRLSRSMA